MKGETYTKGTMAEAKRKCARCSCLKLFAFFEGLWSEIVYSLIQIEKNIYGYMNSIQAYRNSILYEEFSRSKLYSTSVDQEHVTETSTTIPCSTHTPHYLSICPQVVAKTFQKVALIIQCSGVKDLLLHHGISVEQLA